jgi:hypothetical protein
MKRKPVNPNLPGRYGRMTPEEFDAEVAVFDDEFVVSRAKPLTAVMRAEERRARKRGRPRIGKGCKDVLVSIEADLLKRADALARKEKLSRSQLISLGLKAVLNSASRSHQKSRSRSAA